MNMDFATELKGAHEGECRIGSPNESIRNAEQGARWMQANKVQSNPSRLRVLTLDQFLREPIVPRQAMLAPWLLTQSLSMIYAWRGVGKTFVALNIAYAVASAGEFLGWKAERAHPVLYLDGEMVAADLQQRLRAMVRADVGAFDPAFLRIVTPDLQNGSMPDLATAPGQAAIEHVIESAKLIVVDNISTLVRDASPENDAESWNGVGAWALRMRQAGRSVLFLHHSSKAGSQRGSSKKEDTLDVVVCLKRPPDYTPDQGARFEVHFEKSRHGGGQQVNPFEAVLSTDASGMATWQSRPLEETNFDQVVRLAKAGLSQKEIAEELGLNKSTVSRHYRAAREGGLIRKDDQ